MVDCRRRRQHLAGKCLTLQAVPFKRGGRELTRTTGARVVLVIVIWAVFLPPKAWAYLDPGTGSLIFQSLIAALAAVGFTLKLYWGRIRSWFKSSKDTADSERSTSRLS
jgi:hypothetical protein